MQVHRIQVEKTAHYYQYNEPGAHIRQFWIVCHGYGQLADAFLAELKPLHQPDMLVLAPEGMHNHYRKGFSGDVVANWMTKHHRLDQVADYCVFLQKLYDQYLPLLPSDVRIVLLGFSQGCATQCRWILRNKPHFHDLLLWCGLPPEDLDYRTEKEYLADKNLYLIYGSNDPFLTPDSMERLHTLERENDIDFDEQSFEGGHEVQSEALADFLEKLKKNTHEAE